MLLKNKLTNSTTGVGFGVRVRGGGGKEGLEKESHHVRWRKGTFQTQIPHLSENTFSSLIPYYTKTKTKKRGRQDLLKRGRRGLLK